jgi:D-erythrulose 1-phosphate 3-epimerase
MRLRLGVNNCFAVKRWPRPEDWAPLVRDRLELRLVQHSLDLLTNELDFASQADEVREAAATHDLEIHSTFTGLAAYSSNLLLGPHEAQRQAHLAWFRTVIGFTRDVGGRAAGGHVGAFSVVDWGDPARRPRLWAELQASLAGLAAEAKGSGLDYLMVENLAAAREPSTMSMIRDLLTMGDDGHVPVRLCLDVGHMCVPGSSGPDRDPYAWLRDLGPAAPVVQLQQSDAEGDHHWPFTERYNAIGRIDADRVIDALGAGGVEESTLLLEVIPPFEQSDEDVLDDLARSVQYWREALDRRGVLAG